MPIEIIIKNSLALFRTNDEDRFALTKYYEKKEN